MTNKGVASMVRNDPNLKFIVEHKWAQPMSAMEAALWKAANQFEKKDANAS